jgi:hypothetical protein
MTVTTKKYALEKNDYIKLAFFQHLKDQWYWLLIPAGIMILGLIFNFTGVYKNWWILITAFIGGLLYLAFWGAQFAGVTQQEANKQMFDKFIYEIDSRHIMIKVNAKEGGIMKWDNVRSIEKTKDAYLLHMGKAQFLKFPFSIFTSTNDIKLFETIVKRKDLM